MHEFLLNDYSNKYILNQMYKYHIKVVHNIFCKYLMKEENDRKPIC